MTADYAHVVRPYLTAKGLTDDQGQVPSWWAIDFRLITLEQAMRCRQRSIVRMRVKRGRESN